MWYKAQACSCVSILLCILGACAHWPAAPAAVSFGRGSGMLGYVGSLLYIDFFQKVKLLFGDTLGSSP